MNKKITLLLAFLFYTLVASAQIFFSEDFSGGIPVTWTNVDNGTYNVKWRTTTTGALNQSAPVNSQLSQVGTTAANGYLILDSDSAGSGTSEDANLTTAAINCTGHASVHLLFTEYFAQYLTSTGVVKVSNDNVTWVDVHHAEVGLSQDGGTANPYMLDIDISATAANQPTVYIRFQYVGAWDYWWFVDDVKLMEPYSVDASASVQKLDFYYPQVPLSQATNLNRFAEIFNTGVSPTPGGTAVYEIINVTSGQTVFSESIPLTPINPGTSILISPVNPFVPSQSGYHKAKVTISVAGDGNPANDIAESVETNISDSVYARDNGVLQSTLGIGAGPGQDGILGQNFRVQKPGDITSVTFFFDDTLAFNPTGTPVYFTIHLQPSDTAPPDTIPFASTDTLWFLPGDVPSGGSFYTLNIHHAPVHITPGIYYVGLHEVDSLLPIGITSEIHQPNAVWVHWNSAPSPTGWIKPEDFGMSLTYMIRLNFLSPFVSVSEIGSQKSTLLAYPNPASREVNFHWENRNGSSDLTISDILGNIVFQGDYDADNTTVNFDSYPAGVYLVQVVCGQSISRVKVVKN